MKKYLFITLICLFIPTSLCALQLAELESETAEELLLFFEEEELVIATKSPTPVRKAPAIAMVISAKEIRDMGARDLTDVLKMVPGFGISLTESQAHMLEVRGIRTRLSEKVLMMLDGHSLNKNFVGTAMRNHFHDLPLENIKRIEIIRGPGSALYGSNAFAAVINIVTRDADEIDGVEVKGSYGSFESRRTNITGGNVFTNGLRISGSFDYYKTDGAELTIEEDRLSSGPWPSLAPGKTDMRIEKTDIFLKASYKDLTYRGHYMSKESGAYIGLGYALVDAAPFGTDTHWHELSYHHELTSDLTADIKISFDHYEQGGILELFPDGYLGMFPEGLIGGPFLKNNTYGTDVQFGYDLSDTNHITLGAHFERMTQYGVKRVANYLPAPGFTALGSVQETSPEVNWNQNVKREARAVFIQDEWDITDNFDLTAGVRHDRYSDFGETINPRIGLVWEFIKQADLKLLYGTAFRAPDFGELYTDNNVAAMGNPDLDPETIRTYEAGLVIRPSGNFSIDLNYFLNKIDDLITTDTTTSPSYFRNSGKAEVEGIELIMRGKYTADSYWKLAYTYQDPKDPDTGERLPDVPLNRASASINHGLTEHLNLHTDILWTGERSRQTGDTRDPVADYTTVDLALTAGNFSRPVEIQAAVHNLFDEKYEDPDRSGTNQYVPHDFPRPGTTVDINVTYRF